MFTSFSFIRVYRKIMENIDVIINVYNELDIEQFKKIIFNIRLQFKYMHNNIYYGGVIKNQLEDIRFVEEKLEFEEALVINSMNNIIGKKTKGIINNSQDKKILDINNSNIENNIRKNISCNKINLKIEKIQSFNLKANNIESPKNNNIILNDINNIVDFDTFIKFLEEDNVEEKCEKNNEIENLYEYLIESIKKLNIEVTELSKKLKRNEKITCAIIKYFIIICNVTNIFHRKISLENLHEILNEEPDINKLHNCNLEIVKNIDIIYIDNINKSILNQPTKPKKLSSLILKIETDKDFINIKKACEINDEIETFNYDKDEIEIGKENKIIYWVFIKYKTRKKRDVSLFDKYIYNNDKINNNTRKSFVIDKKIRDKLLNQ